MPIIPQYVARNSPEGLPGPRSVDVGGQSIARGISALGSGLRDVAQSQFAIQDADQQKKQRDGLVAADTAYSIFQVQQKTRLKEMQLSAKEGDIAEFTPNFQKQYDDSFAELRKGISGPMAQQLVAGRGAVLREELTGASTLFEAEQGIHVRMSGVEKAGEARQTLVRADPSKYQEELDKQFAIIEAAGFSADDARAQRDSARENISVSAVLTQATIDPIGIIKALGSAPGESGNAAIENLTPNGRSALLNFARQEFTRLVSAEAQRDAAAERAQRERHEKGEQSATLALLKGTLSMGDLQNAVATDALDPSTARTLASAMQSGDSETDPRTLFAVKADVLSYTEAEIRDMPGLSWKDKSALFDQRRQSEGSWQDSNEFQEARGRIDRELKIPPGAFIGSLSDDVLNARATALTALYDRVNAMPLDQRRGAAISQSELVIQEIIKSNSQKEAATLRKRLAKYKAENPNPEDMSGSGKRSYDQTVDALSRRIVEAESK